MNDYVTVRIPISITSVSDKLIGKYGFDSRADVIKAALREFAEKFPETKILTQSVEA
jgi:Arc/MetJ-type ribon-helix-helix transcriptional regulator